MSDDKPKDASAELQLLRERRDFIKKAAAGTALIALGGGLYRLASDAVSKKARAEKRTDGRRRLPPGQRVIRNLKPMGGEEGDPSAANYRLLIHGQVKKRIELTYADLRKLNEVQASADVHCVTGWSMLGGLWTGVKLSDLADLAGVKASARHVIFEAAHGYTANVTIEDALKPNVMVAHRLNGRRFARQHGAPVRALVPDLYFWKSAKWLNGIRFVEQDVPGYWETRGYNNHADPWLEERYDR